MTERDLQRWSREVAEDPGAAPFVRLARAYRRQGRRDAARDIVLGGLARHPEHVDAHALLALIHVEGGQRQQAQDEWETVLRLDPGNFDASRGLGFLALERGDLGQARRHLDSAAASRPGDPAVSQARRVLERRERTPGTPSAPPAARPSARSAARGMAPAPARPDPVSLFADLTADGGFRGALILDERGMVLAGRLQSGDDADELLGAMLSAAVDEAIRTTALLGLGAWEEMLIETDSATLHLTALPEAAVLVVAAEPDTPPGWVVRVATRAAEVALRFMEVGK